MQLVLGLTLDFSESLWHTSFAVGVGMQLSDLWSLYGIRSLYLSNVTVSKCAIIFLEATSKENVNRTVGIKEHIIWLYNSIWFTFKIRGIQTEFHCSFTNNPKYIQNLAQKPGSQTSSSIYGIICIQKMGQTMLGKDGMNFSEDYFLKIFSGKLLDWRDLARKCLTIPFT